MDKQTMKTTIAELAGMVQYHADLYYNKSKPEVTDAEYDAMVDKLKLLVADLERMDSSAPEIAMGREVLNNVGATPSYGRKVKHDSVMGSLDKDTKVSGIAAWNSKYGGAGKLAVSPKMDGLSLRLNYSDGRLVQAASRGDGIQGQDVTDNVRAMKSVPKFIGAGKTCEVRAEVIMPRSVFKALAENGERAFANPRNAASGSLMAQDPTVTGSRNLDIRAYDVKTSKQFTTEAEKRAWMVTNLPGIMLVDMEIITIEQFESIALKWEAQRPTLDYEIDGLVIALDSIAAQEEAGWDGNRPRGKIAFKFAPEQKIAKVLGIDWQVGRTGRLTPMARIEPTLLAGSTIRNITLHNAARVKELDVAIGDEILIEKCGDVIPGVCRVVERSANRNTDVYTTSCPSCGGEVVMDDQKVSLWCHGLACPAQLERRILHWVKTLDIMGVGEGIVSELCAQGFVKDVPDLYFLTLEQLRSVTGGDVAATKAQQAILSKSEVPLAVFLDALGIDGLGTTTSKEVAKKYSTLANVMKATAEELDAMPDIGALTASKIVEGLKLFQEMINRLAQTLDIQEVVMKEGTLKGKTFLITGTLSVGRKEIESLIESGGGVMVSSVGKKLNYLILGDDPGSKLDKAKAAGIPIISEAELRKMIGG